MSCVMLLALLMTLEVAAGGEIVGAREADRSRIQAHLSAVEAELRSSDVGHLPSALQAERQRNLDRLRDYWVAGEFPRNSGHPGERVPYFVDDEGVVCAVGHLVVESGFGAVAEDIRAQENNARLLDMTHPALPAWISASGLTAEECARIQPSYCKCDEEYAPVCTVSGHSYLNTCEAVTCAGEVVAHAGLCEAPGTSGWPAPGDSGEAGTGGSSGGSTGSTGTGTGDASSSGSDATGDSQGPGDDRHRGRGCRVAGPGAGASMLALLLLGLRRRRRV